MFDPVTLLAMLGPIAVEAGKAIINRFIVPDKYKPTSIAEYIQMQAQELEFFKAITEAGGTNPTYLWVEAVVRLMRPLVAAVVLGTWATAHFQGVPDTATIDNFAAAIGFYLFGDRTLFYAKKK